MPGITSIRSLALACATPDKCHLCGPVSLSSALGPASGGRSIQERHSYRGRNMGGYQIRYNTMTINPSYHVKSPGIYD
ncbi:hypothetical protein P691DRAFT_204449 [Macrolepiota fuliginosa MF-IS2]|uniref:Uncharacterized protein n=1 Tax=Macrolepiota fuliginosa MF-IS2 TaxID=1400762 RepID=A0A9P5XNP9_9AGAR|nr:hypothetical protein P691DRAFT_204449 [Macrolepiota fuliginosa MF-IS2]